jgi:predicted ferric reductase
MPAVVGEAHGHFDHHRGTDAQVWIAAGVGITPFLSWLRAVTPGELAGNVDFFYSTAGPAPFADELKTLAAQHAGFRLHLVDTSVQGRLDAQTVLAVTGADPHRLSVFMCGPSQMLATFERRFRTADVPRRNIVREHFDLR